MILTDSISKAFEIKNMVESCMDSPIDKSKAQELEEKTLELFSLVCDLKDQYIKRFVTLKVSSAGNSPTTVELRKNQIKMVDVTPNKLIVHTKFGEKYITEISEEHLSKHDMLLGSRCSLYIASLMNYSPDLQGCSFNPVFGMARKATDFAKKRTLTGKLDSEQLQNINREVSCIIIALKNIHTSVGNLLFAGKLAQPSHETARYLDPNGILAFESTSVDDQDCNQNCIVYQIDNNPAEQFTFYSDNDNTELLKGKLK